jgi:putative transposase
VLGVSLRTLQRWDQAPDLADQRKGPRTEPANKLTAEDREQVVAIATSVQYRDTPPSKIVPALADEGLYVASESSFYRILQAESLLRHRSAQRPPTHHRPEAYEAVAPNRVWSWDITYIRSSIRGMFFYLYLVMDIYSRKVVGWEAHERESSELGSQLIRNACEGENIDGKGLVIHSDNGGPMKGATMLATLQRLGVVPSFSRPSVSDDNPYSEALFKTMKYCSLFPLKPFRTLEETRQWVGHFVEWYNNEHLHSSIKYVTPSDRHDGLDVAILEQRKDVYEEAKKKNPSRWSGKTRNWEAVQTVQLNPCKEDRRSNIQRTA